MLNFQFLYLLFHLSDFHQFKKFWGKLICEGIEKEELPHNRLMVISAVSTFKIFLKKLNNLCDTYAIYINFGKTFQFIRKWKGHHITLLNKKN